MIYGMAPHSCYSSACKETSGGDCTVGKKSNLRLCLIDRPRKQKALLQRLPLFLRITGIRAIHKAIFTISCYAVKH